MPCPVEVLVVSYDSAGVIRKLLASLRTYLPDASIAIREHAPDRRCFEALERLTTGHTAPIRIEHDPTNPGFGAGCNALAAGSSAEFLLFLNPDTELEAWPWSEGVPPPPRAVIGPMMTDEAAQHFGRRFRIRDEIALSWLRRQPQPPAGSGYVSGAALLIERSAFERIGGFDATFFMFYEDIDLCLRANAAGYPTVINERWRVRHARHHSTVSRFEQSLMWSYDSAIRYYAKHGSPVWAYRAYKSVDAIMRAAAHGARGDVARAKAYLALAGRSAVPRRRSARRLVTA